MIISFFCDSRGIQKINGVSFIYGGFREDWHNKWGNFWLYIWSFIIFSRANSEWVVINIRHTNSSQLTL